MSMTVTVTQGGSTANGIGLDVRVVTGQAASPVGATATSTTANDKSITPQATGSFIYGATTDNPGGTFTAAAGTTLRMNVQDVGNGVTYGGFRRTAATTTLSAVTVGSSTSSVGTAACALLEIKAASGGTLAEDASTPAVATTTTATAVSTAAFTPPPGAILVAEVSSDTPGAGTTTATVTDSSGLTWTLQVTAGGNGATSYLSQVWTAVVPGAAAAGAVRGQQLPPRPRRGPVSRPQSSAGARVTAVPAPVQPARPPGRRVPPVLRRRTQGNAGAPVIPPPPPVVPPFARQQPARTWLPPVRRHVQSSPGAPVTFQPPATPSPYTAARPPRVTRQPVRRRSQGSPGAPVTAAGPVTPSPFTRQQLRPAGRGYPRRWRQQSAAGSAAIPAPFPQVPLGILVEMLVGTQWTDITRFVRARDVISITRGRPDESGFVNPSQMTLTLNNRDYRFSYKNPVGPWYGLIGKNTQVRLSVQGANPDDGSRVPRYWGELAEVPYSQDATGTDRWVQAQVAGILRRLQQQGALGTSPAPLPLPLGAYYASLAGTQLAFVAWWPCTDPAGSTQFASGAPGVPPMRFSGPAGLAASSVFPGSAAVATFSKSQWTGLLAGASQGAGSTSTVTDTLGPGSQPYRVAAGVSVLQRVTSYGPGGGGAPGVGGGADNGGGGGGGGGVTVAANVAVTGGAFYHQSVGIGGPGGSPGQAGGQDGTADTSFPGDSATVTGGAGKGATGATGGAGGSGDNPGGKGGNSGNDENGGGGGGAGGSPGADGLVVGGGTGGFGGNGGGRGGSTSGGDNGTGGSGQSPGGGGAGAGPGSSGFGGGGADGAIVIQYQRSSGGNITVDGGPQNANVLRFLLDIPAAGDFDGGEVTRLLTSGTVAIAQVFYHQGIAILSAGLGATAITSLPVDPLPEPVVSGATVTVTGQNGTSQQFHVSSTAATGATSVPVTSATPVITTEAGDVVTAGSDHPGYLQLFLLNSSFTPLLDTGLKNVGADGTPMMVSVELAQDGTGIDWTFQVVPVGEPVPVAFTGTVASATVGSVGAVLMNPGGLLDGTACGQVTVQYATSPITALGDPLAAYDGEAAGRRFLRLCAQQGIGAEIAGDPDATVAMGVQASDTFVNLMQSVETADRGQVYESRNLLGLGYRTRASLLSQPPLIVADYAAQVLPSDPPLIPVDDDQYTANDITGQRAGGSQLELVQQAGRLSVQPPPAGVGPYTATVQAALHADGQLPDFTGWLLHLGTSDEYRFPAIPLRMERHQVTDAGLWAAVAQSDVGAYVQILNPPAGLTPDPIRQLVLGFNETFSNNDTERTWTLALNCVPEAPYEVAVADTATCRADTTGSTLHADLDAATGTFEVDTTLPGSALWDTAGGDDPFDIVVAGERMTVTSITPLGSGSASSPAAFTDIVFLTVAPGVYLVRWLVTLSGTLSGADVNNFGLYNGSTFVAGSINPGAAGTWLQAPQTVTVTGGAPDIKILAGGTAPTAGAVYGASVLTPQAFTVTRSVNGVVKSHLAGEAVALFFPPIASI